MASEKIQAPTGSEDASKSGVYAALQCDDDASSAVTATTRRTGRLLSICEREPTRLQEISNTQDLCIYLAFGLRSVVETTRTFRNGLLRHHVKRRLDFIQSRIGNRYDDIVVPQLETLAEELIDYLTYFLQLQDPDMLQAVLLVVQILSFKSLFQVITLGDLTRSSLTSIVLDILQRHDPVLRSSCCIILHDMVIWTESTLDMPQLLIICPPSDWDDWDVHDMSDTQQLLHRLVRNNRDSTQDVIDWLGTQKRRVSALSVRMGMTMDHMTIIRDFFERL